MPSLGFRTLRGLTLVLSLACTLAAAAQSEVDIEKFTNGQDADTAPGPGVPVGSTVFWTYIVTNTGSRPLTNISVTDDQGVTVSCPDTTLDAGLSFTCTASGTAIAGQYANIGTVTATLQDATVVSDSDPSHYFGQGAPSVAIEKRTNGIDADTPPGPSVPVGSTVNWDYEITNIGAEGLEDVAVTDDQGVSVSCPAKTLAIGASMTCTASGIAQVGQYANIGTVTATLSVSGTDAVASDASHYFGLSQPFDFGDAPDPTYPSLFASNGARHLLGGPVFLGNCVDAEADAFASAMADGDDLATTTPFGTCVTAGDDEDGVTFTTSLSAGQTAGVDVVASAPCTLSAWIDYSGDGDWGESDEDLFPGGTALAAGTNSLNFTVPAIVAPGNTFARFRCTTDGAVGFTGPANDGEVEDYAVALIAPVVSATKTAALTGDADGDTLTDPGDALTYTITITNSGGAGATSVTFTDTPDSNTTLVAGSVTTSTGTITAGNGVGDTFVSVNAGTIAASGGSATITFTVLVDDPLPPGVTTVSNQGTISGTNFASVPSDDPAVAGPADPTVITITLTPIVTATKTAALFGDVDGDNLADPGDTLRYTITVANTGNGDASGVLFTDTPDANTALVNGSVTTSMGAVTSGNTPGQTAVAVNIGALAAGGTAVIVFDVTIDNPLPPGVTQVVNSGTVTGSNITPVMTDDPSLPGNADPTAVAVEAAAAAAVAIPTFGTWAVLALAALLGVIAVRRITFG
jgi:uncharacterized repeat protein (TIGR01451 family)